jgi:hypothetical protein
MLVNLFEMIQDAFCRLIDQIKRTQAPATEKREKHRIHFVCMHLGLLHHLCQYVPVSSRYSPPNSGRTRCTSCPERSSELCALLFDRGQELPARQALQQFPKHWRAAMRKNRVREEVAAAIARKTFSHRSIRRFNGSAASRHRHVHKPKRTPWDARVTSCTSE